MLKSSLLSVVLLLFVIAFVARSAEVATEDEVLVLTNENFDEVITQHQFVLVEFYAPWCGHCKQLAPNYAAAAKQLKEDGSEVKLAKVDATVHTALAKRFDVSGYPTLYFFKNGAQSEYNGGRSKDDILLWIRKKTGPATTAVESETELKTFMEAHPVVVLGRFTQGADSESYKAFVQVASQNSDDNVEYLTTTSSQLLSEQLPENSDGIVLFKKFDEGVNVYEGDLSSVESISQFVRRNSQPLYHDFVNSPSIFQGPIREHFFLFIKRAGAEDGESVTSAVQSTFDSAIEALKEVANEFRGRAVFSFVDVSNPQTNRITDFFGIREADAPQVRYISLDDTTRKFKAPSNEINAQEWKDLLKGIYDGTATPFLKSEEPVPYSGTGVRVLTGKDHDEIVKDPSKHVFVEYYAPWCGHCKQLAPTWEKLAAEYANHDNVVIAKLDGTTNEVAGVNIRGFPTLIFYPAGENAQPVPYSGGRDFASLKKTVDEALGISESSHEHQEHDEL